MPTNRLPTPGQDSGNWGTLLNGFLTQSLDNNNGGGINKFDTFSLRPTTLGQDDKGKTFLYTQTGNFHQWTGTEWKVLNESVINVKDYGAVGDGVSDDTAAIQGCLDRASDNDSIQFDSSNYKINTRLNINSKSNLFLKGMGTLVLNSLDYIIWIEDSQNITIDGLTFTNPNNFTYKKDIQDAVIENSGGISFRNSTTITIQNCKMDNFYWSIISNTWTDDFTRDGDKSQQAIIKNNTITNVIGASYEGGGDGINITIPYSVIQNNNVSLKQGTEGRGGIVLDGNSHDSLVSNNYISGLFRRSIHVESAGGNSENTVIENNHCYGSGSTTLTNDSFGAIIVTANKVVIRNNFISPKNSAIMCRDANELLIDGNTIIAENDNLAHGILITGKADKDGIVIGNNNITNNIFKSVSGKKYQYPIYISDSKNTNINTNKVINVCSGVIIYIINSNNFCISNNQLDTSVSDAITVLNSTYGIISSNIIKNSGGVAIGTNGSNFIISLNHIYWETGTGHSPFYFGGNDNTMLQVNNIIGS
jgi:hypothetical protein